MIQRLLLTAIALCVSLLLVEVYCRGQPLDRVQRVMQMSNRSLRMIGDVPVWKFNPHVDERVANAECLDTAQNGPDVYLVGDSIFFGVKLDPEDTLGPRLQNLLTTGLQRDACVVNLSQPGFSFFNEEAVLREAVAERKPRVVVLELWGNSPNRLQMLKGVAYNFGSMATDEHGFPNPGVSPDLNRWLFGSSALWRHLSTGLAKHASRSSKDVWRDFVKEDLEPFRVWLEGNGIELVLAYATSLKTPFSDGRPVENMGYGSVRSWAQKHGIAEVVFSEVFANEDPTAIGIDACCHLNEEGTRMISEAIAVPLMALLQPDAARDPAVEAPILQAD